MNMTTHKLENLNIAAFRVLVSPEALHEQIPANEQAAVTVESGREAIRAILDRRDPRLLVVVGPCSIHDVAAAREYATRLKRLHDELGQTLYLVMRVYFEKPRTTVGWKGFINDPHLDDSFAIEEGLAKARELLIWLAELGLPTGTEALDPISPQYLADLFAWAAIGARTTESQTHREMSSGLSTPIGFKNGTDGNLDVAINALQSAAAPHAFLGISPSGQVAVVETRGNRYGHVILRGGHEPNYDSVSIALTEQALAKAGMSQSIIVDCSHANSHKNHELQPLVAMNIANQIQEGNRSIVGLMLESNLHAGNQKMTADPADLRYGVSITDACIDWETTEQLLRDIAAKLAATLPARLVP
jgi:3-deoxy-7-phosphoheptulonate synthase